MKPIPVAEPKTITRQRQPIVAVTGWNFKVRRGKGSISMIGEAYGRVFDRAADQISFREYLDEAREQLIQRLGGNVAHRAGDE